MENKHNDEDNEDYNPEEEVTGDWKVKDDNLQILHSYANEIINQRGLDVKFSWTSRMYNHAGTHLDKLLKNGRLRT